MKHFVQYHNTEKMGYSASTMPEPRMFTDKSVKNVSGNAVWLISGEGKSPKSFYLAAVFKSNRTSTGTYDHPKYKNAAYGPGHIFGETIEVTRLPWFQQLKSDQKNFKNGLSEVTNVAIIAELQKLAGPHAL